MKLNNYHRRYLSLFGMLMCVFEIIACFAYASTHFAINLSLLYIVIVMAAGVLLFRLFYKEYKILDAGIKGEKESYKVLKNLPKEYKVYKNVPLEFKKQRTELDQFIMSQYGIVIVETKSYSGKLFGHENDQQWTYIKHLPKGKTQTTKIKNPLMQLEREIYILTRILKKEHIDIPIIGYVYLIKGECEVETQQLFTNNDKLLSAIQSHKNKVLSKNQIKKIKEVLDL